MGEPVGFASIDVSFISLTKGLEPVKNLLSPDGQIVCLIKPQFEAGREKVGKKGVVREKSTHIEVIEKVIAYARSIGFATLALEYSPIKGPEGNIEYLLYLDKSEDAANRSVKGCGSVSCGIIAYGSLNIRKQEKYHHESFFYHYQQRQGYGLKHHE